ncbi:MAG: NPCBM/NEW2 domain-containing protein, partial [Lachnospiraceae bacterium]|nr:NPCBM/NEW2 domain-containing protein [Lachnospiraceae bacterium]
EGYESAISCLKGGYDLLPNDEAIKAKIAEYSEYQPVALYDLEYFNSGSSKQFGDKKFYRVDNGVKLNDGTTYEKGICMGYYEWEEYKIDGAYKVFTGRLGMSFEDRSANRVKESIKVYGDDVLLYTSTSFLGGVEPEDFSIDITGIDKLKIERQSAENHITDLYMVNALLYK